MEDGHWPWRLPARRLSPCLLCETLNIIGQIKNAILVFQRTFHYDSQFWSNRNAYNFAGGKTGFDSQETKLSTYWNTSFSTICLGMKINHQLRLIVINRHANSLFSLIADGKYRATSLGRNTWKSLIGSQEIYMMIPTRAEMRQRTRQIMETSTSKPWGISWYSDRGHS